MSIGVAIIGSGIFAKEEHLPAVLAAPHLTLKAVYSRRNASAKALAPEKSGSIDIYADDLDDGNDYAALLKRSDIHAVIIALPILTQPQFIREALTAKKHVFSEKPIAKDVQDARALVNWYRHESKLDTKAVTWGIAENFRYLGTMEYGRQAVQQLGRVLGVQVRVYSNTKAGGKYFETPWRKTPDYQGGFLLDGGVHYVAATRFLLGDADSVVRVSAQTAMLQKHLPPIDTLDGVLKTKNGVTGTISIGFGTTLPGYEFSVACEHGSVTVGPKSVVVRQDDGRDGKETKKEYPDQGMGVMAEVKAWAEGLHAGKLDEKQSPEEALKDLMLLEALLQSREKNGVPQDVTL